MRVHPDHTAHTEAHDLDHGFDVPDIDLAARLSPPDPSSIRARLARRRPSGLRERMARQPFPAPAR